VPRFFHNEVFIRNLVRVLNEISPNSFRAGHREKLGRATRLETNPPFNLCLKSRTPETLNADEEKAKDEWRAALGRQMRTD
jgi:hypothetical protein